MVKAPDARLWTAHWLKSNIKSVTQDTGKYLYLTLETGHCLGDVFFRNVEAWKTAKGKLHSPFETTARIISQPDKSTYKVAWWLTFSYKFNFCSIVFTYLIPYNDWQEVELMKKINLSRVLIENRHKRGLTQEDLAAYMGVSKTAVSKWETGGSLS